MEWMNRGDQRQNQTAAGNQQTSAAAQANAANNSKLGALKSMKIAQVALLFSAVILVVAVIALVATGGGVKKEASIVDKNKLQAVFLNGGQVYFGKIDDLNNKFLKLDNIYYLRVNQQVQPTQAQNNNNDISLVKLGCELHGPQDSMVINREQVIFWENLKDDGQVAKAVANYKQQNPGEQKCDTAGTGTTNTPATGTGTTNNTNTNTGGTGTTNQTTNGTR